jgi:hypothetical protein
VAGPLSRLWWLRRKISLLGRGGNRDGGRRQEQGREAGVGWKGLFFWAKEKLPIFLLILLLFSR